MLLRNRFCFWPAVTAILLLAGVLRVYQASYGYADICLTLPTEYWLYDQSQVSSLYTPNVKTVSLPTVEDLTVTYPRSRAVAAAPDELVFLRLLGAVAGLLTVALVLCLGRLLRANWWAQAGALVAVAPWLVAADRWVIRFDPAPLAVAASLVLLALSYRWRRSILVWLQLVTALSLLLVAPPLWWLALGLILLQPRRDWRIVVFIILIGLVSLPALQSLAHWLAAASQWDEGSTAAGGLAVLGLALWHWRTLKPPIGFALMLLAVIGGGLSVIQAASLPHLSAAQWELTTWLQNRIPDGARVSFDSAAWDTAAVVACPLSQRVRLMPQRLDSWDTLPPDFIATADPTKLQKSAFIYDLGNGFYVGRQIELSNSVDIPFGDLLHVLSYDLLTPQVRPGAVVNLRLDYQLGPAVDAGALAYSAFVHVTRPGQPGEKIVEYSVPFIAEMNVFGPRVLVLNNHYRFNLPAQVEPGRYDVLFGIYDVYSGQRLLSPIGDVLPIGQIEVSAG